MRVLTLPMAVLIVTAALGGCGQKGPLYRETPVAAPDSAEASGASSGLPDERGEGRQ